jgi:hypothetical protein
MEFDQFGEDPQEFFVEFFTSYRPKDSRRSRWKAAWRVFLGKDPWLHDVCLGTEEMTQFKEFLDATLPSPVQAAFALKHAKSPNIC